MVKCYICGKKIKENFLGKVFGTYIKDSNKKKRIVCPECQKKFLKKEDLIKELE